MLGAWREPRSKRERASEASSTSVSGPHLQSAGAIVATSIALAVKRTAAVLNAGRLGLSGAKRLHFSQQLLSVQVGDPRLELLHSLLSTLPADERDWWIGNFHTLLMPAALRRRLAAHFTPPTLARHVLAFALEAGMDLRAARVIDPCAGGAAFLSTLGEAMLQSGAPPEDILARLTGLELDPQLAALAEAILARRLGLASLGRHVVSVGDARRAQRNASFDAVFANPPYGRLLGVTKAERRRWAHLAEPGHINLYAIFVGISLEFLRNGGIAALVLPTSFLAGPLFARLRAYIRSQAEVLSIHVLEAREGVFLEVTQDTCVMLLRKGTGSGRVHWGLIPNRGSSIPLGTSVLPSGPNMPWVMPARSLPENTDHLARLSNWGLQVRAGYFVWNRERHRMRTARKGRFDVPLIWARNVSCGSPVYPVAKDTRGMDFVQFDRDSAAIIRRSAIILQRTTNNRQPRRLIAAPLAPEVLSKFGGFVTENHTLVLLPDENKTASPNLNLIAQLLGSAAVDAMYRRSSGTASVSVAALRDLPLPWPADLQATLAQGLSFDDAVRVAYEMAHQRLVK
ncbi:N-6 DNA methylase [Myxococcus sp. XM-1-1-1]|uniref:N-6 DNA methylase n=2 Tax=unclassified Myxococcus TaxID=2648731 RepID=UPI00351D9740